MLKGGLVMCVNEVELPAYTRKMEFWNSFTHALGVVFALAMFPLSIEKALAKTDALGLVSIVICLVFMILLYGGSALYHGLKPGYAKRLLRVFDHNNVFLQVMGSYLPFCWIALREPQDGVPWGWIIFAIVWGLSLLGIALNSVHIHRFRVVNYILQVAVGSVIVLAVYPLYRAIGWEGVVTCLSSGVLYWIGAALYAVAKKKSLWVHTVFHVFVLLGSVVMYLSIYFFVL